MEKKIPNIKEYLILGTVTLMACLGFLVYSINTAGLGFPLDDAWIHQAFARNFAEYFSWSFQMGVPSGGSTGPLWGLILSVIYVFGIPPVWATHFVGYLILWACSVAGFQIGKKLLPDNKWAPLAFGVVIGLEWHLVWAALSGMETLLLVLISLLIFRWILDGKENWWIPGLLTGLAVWIRPDGLTFIGPVIFCWILKQKKIKIKLLELGKFLGPAVLITAAYFLFNKFVAGDFWPNTFYAKQAEYEILRQTGILTRYLKLSKQILTGVGVVLLPGFVYEIWDIFVNRDYRRASILLWAAGYVGVYALRLPVIYQHGRYIMPAIPPYLFIGMAGIWRAGKFRAKSFWPRVISLAWMGTVGVVLVVFGGLGARAYALDVGVIETEMVEVALWVSENTAEDAVIGAHDIGGLGYYGGREIIDLAGLIDPEVIPYIRNQDLLAEFLDQERADYLITFPGWYPELIDGLEVIYTSSGEYSTVFGMEPMAVYRWE